MKLGCWALVASAMILAACGQQSSGGQAPSPEAKRLLLELPSGYQSADLENGKFRFALCRSCHTAVQGGPDMTGPNLYGVFGRKAGSRPGFDYSDAVRTSGITWDADHLDKWLARPRAYLPGTKMTFVGINDDEDRRDLIAYLKVVSSGGPR